MRALALALSCLAPMAAANAVSDPASHPSTQVVAVHMPKAVSEIPYRHYLEIQYHLGRYLPPGPRLVDPWFRIGTAGVSETERDAQDPGQWAVAVRSRSVDVAVPVRRGAYLSLPEIQAAYDERGEIVIHGSYRPWMSVWWTLRVPESRRMPYADVAAAREQIGAVQRRISTYAAQLRNIKRAPFDGIKACFLDGSGAILVDGKAVADVNEGNCKVLFLDAARLARRETLEFSGPLDIVSFVDRRYYAGAK